MRYFKKIPLILILFASGIFISEIILFFISKQTVENRELKFQKDKKIILCLGDSYTFGGEVENKDSYPLILSELVKKMGFTAINGGVCEADTTKILEKYRYFLKSIKPEKVIFLGGSANFFGYKSPDNFFLKKLRSFKLIKIFITDIKAKYISSKARNEIYTHHLPFDIDKSRSYTEDEENFYTERTMFFLFEKRDFKKAYDIVQNGLKRFPKSINLKWLFIDISFKINRNEEAEKEIEFFKSFVETFKADDKISRNAKGRIIRGLAEWELINYNFDTASEKMIESLKYLDHLTPYDVYVIKQSLMLQSSLSADKIHREILSILNSNTDIASDNNFKNLINYFKEFKKYENERIEWIKSDINEIIKILKENNIKLYIMTYPYPYKKVNEILRQVAIENKLTLIDCEKYFIKITSNNRKKYFKDSDHLSAEGNRYLSNIILKEIFK